MNWRNWIYCFSILIWMSCKDKEQPCITTAQIWGATLDGHDKATYRKLVYWIDSFDVKFANGTNVNVIPNYSDSTFFLETPDMLNAEIYFRIKPSLNYDTIHINGHLSSWKDANCSGLTYLLDSTTHNGRTINADRFFYYEQ